MAEKIDDCEFWLPPHFLTDDDLSLLNINPKNDAVLKSRFPYLTSPAESETESEEEELMNELTRRMAHSSLRPGFPFENHKIVFGTFSPQSTLCTMECNGKGSSPNGKGSSPNGGVLPQANTQKATLDLLRAAAGEVERMKLHEEEKVYGVLRNTVKPSPIGPSFFAQPHQHSLAYRHSQLAQFEMMKMQQQQLAMQKQGLIWGYGNGNYYNNQMLLQNRGRNDTVFQGLSSSAKQKAVFAGNPNVIKERNGTGVFLPRVYNNVRSESRKKPVGSAALVPVREVHAVKAKVHAVKPKVQAVARGNSQHNKNRSNGKSIMENGPVVIAKNKSDNGLSGQKPNLKQQPQPVNQEIQLPQEWTY